MAEQLGAVVDRTREGLRTASSMITSVNKIFETLIVASKNVSDVSSAVTQGESKFEKIEAKSISEYIANAVKAVQLKLRKFRSDKVDEVINKIKNSFESKMILSYLKLSIVQFN